MKTKTILLVLAMVLSNGCATNGHSPPVVKPSRIKITGAYEHIQGGVIYKRIFLDNGIMEYHVNNEKKHESKWAKSDIHFRGYTSPTQIILTTVDSGIATEFLVMEANDDLTWIASSKEGTWHEFQRPLTFKKIR